MFISLLPDGCVCVGPTLQTVIQLADSVHVGRRQAYRVKNLVSGVTDAEYLDGFQRLPAYLRALKTATPGTTAEVEVNEDGTFRRLFVVLGPSVTAAMHCLNVSSLDSSFIKFRYNGQLAIWEFMDPAGRLLPIAFAIFDKENKENYKWFLSLCVTSGLGAVINDEGHVVFSDRSKGLIPALADVTPRTVHMYCTRHIISDIHPSLSISDRGLVWAIQGAYSHRAYLASVDTLRKRNASAANYIADIPPERWCLHTAVLHDVRLYGRRTSNNVESENARALPARDMPVPRLVDRMVCLVAELFESGKALAQKESDSGRIITQHYMRFYEKNVTDADGWTAILASPSTGSVTRPNKPGSSVQARFLVDLGKRTCSCGMWRQLGYPCVHAVCLARRAGVIDGDVWFTSYFDVKLRVQSLVQCYAGVIQLPATIGDHATRKI